MPDPREAEPASSPPGASSGRDRLFSPPDGAVGTLGALSLRFLPSELTAQVAVGGAVLEAAAGLGLSIEAPCGGRKLCGKCRVAFLEGAPPPTAVERELVSAEDLAGGVRLACRSRPRAGATVRLLPPPRVDWWKLGATDTGVTRPDPAVRVIKCHLPTATLKHPTALTTLLRTELGEFDLPLAVLRSLGGRWSSGKGGCALHAVVVGDTVAEVRPAPGPGEQSAPVCGVALDIGTTTIVGYLLELTGGRQLAAASAMNPQASFGSDLISRLHAVLDDPTNLQRLREAVVGAAGRIIQRACREAGCAPEQVYEVTVAANTCMHHLLLGLDASALATSPFAPVVAAGLDLPAADVGLPVHPRANVHLLPNVAGFVGADTIAGILASGIAHADGWRLLLDVGTNAEIVLGCRDRLLACSAAAGPAFEGGNVSCGTVARDGAVSRVRWEDGRLRAETVGGSPAVGVCGSGLLDAVRVLLELGVVLPSGRLLAPERWPEPVRQGLRWSEDPSGVVLARGDRPVVLTQGDVRQLQLAKGAVRAACELLLRTAGVAPAELEEVLLAGAFGNYLDPGSVLALGLVPPVAPHRLRSIGNAAGTGAKLALLERSAREEAARLGQAVEYLELSLHPGFQDAFMEAMAFGD